LVFSGNEGLYLREEVRFLISFLRSVANFDDSVSFYHLSISPTYQLSVRDLTLCMNYASRRNRSLFYVFSHLSGIPELEEEVSPEGKTIIDRVIRDLGEYADLSIKRSTGEVLYEFITKNGYLKRLISSPSPSDEEKVKNIARFFDIIRSTSIINCEIFLGRFPPQSRALVK
ncbi:unnamed protein product, partial [marine sediment metagenome]